MSADPIVPETVHDPDTCSTCAAIVRRAALNDPAAAEALTYEYSVTYSATFSGSIIVDATSAEDALRQVRRMHLGELVDYAEDETVTIGAAEIV